MATRNMVPRANGEGGIGTSIKKWFEGWFKTVNAETLNVSGDTTITGGLSTGSVKSDLIPDADNTRSVGSDTKNFKDVKAKQITLGGVSRIAWPGSGSATVALTDVFANGPAGNIPSGQKAAFKNSTGVIEHFSVDEATGRVEIPGRVMTDATTTKKHYPKLDNGILYFEEA